MEKRNNLHPYGCTSVTFRSLDPFRIIQLSTEVQADCIEWGSDVHATAEDQNRLIRIAQQCAEQDLKICSLGSYYKCCQGLDPKKDFAALIHTAKILKAPVIRIWAGRTASAQADELYFKAMVSEVRQCCDMAEQEGIIVAFEYHRRSLTDTADSAVSLLKAVNRNNCKTYWQPNPELSCMENREELKKILPWLCRVHVFSWLPDNTRLPLQKQEAEWKSYLQLIPDSIPLLIEFVKDDSTEQFIEDMNTLRRWICAE